MTLRPRSVTEENVSAVIDAGISVETLIDAIEVAVVLKLITRYAGALDFVAPNAASLAVQSSRWSSQVGGRDLPVL
jgi:hypothetical protein